MNKPFGGFRSPFEYDWDDFFELGWGGKKKPGKPAPTPNTAPETADDYIRTDDRRVEIDVLSNDTDANGDRLSIATINGIDVTKKKLVLLRDDHGKIEALVRIERDGDLVVTKARKDASIDFTYTVTDGKSESPPATVVVADESTTFRLSLLHFTDQEAGARAVEDAPNLSAVLNALRGDDVEADATITLSSGDAFIPGLFYDASAAVYGAGGVADILIQNELGVQAIAFGNHEFDFGTASLAGLISGGAPANFDFTGSAFPYLSTNLDFSTDPNLAPLAVAGGGAPQGNVVTSSIVLDEGGEKIGVVGATTPTLDFISSPGDLLVLPEAFDAAPTPEQLDALAALIQEEVDTLLAANPDMNKVVLLAHMQQIGIEQDLAARLTDVDIIVAGGSNTRLFDDNDRPRDGDSDQGQYPIFVDNAGGTTTAIVNTDGSYKYVGRLVIDFDDDGNIIPASYDEDVSGAYATDAQGVVDLGAEGLVDPEIQEIADAILEQILLTEGNVLGVSDVFLNGNRSGTGAADDPDGVRTQETNLGNITADANLAYANTLYGDGDDIWFSIKNGGGIRASIGETFVPPGGTEAIRTVSQEILDADGNVVKPLGGISQNDIQTSLAFNNDLVVGSLGATEVVALLEWGVGALPAVSGRFLQISGIQFSFDPDDPVGARVDDAVFVDETGAIRAVLVDDGVVVDPTAEYGVVTLGFLATGGDGYPFPTDFVLESLLQTGVQTGAATFADDGSEQDALAEYLLANFATPETAFAEADTGPDADLRIQNLNFQDGLALDMAVDEFLLT